MNRRTPIGVGDLVRAFAALQPRDDEAQARLAEALGQFKPVSAPSLSTPAVSRPERPPIQRPEQSSDPLEADESLRPADGTHTAGATDLVRLPRVAPTVPAWVTDAEPFPRDEFADEPTVDRPALIPPAQMRARIVRMLATSEPAGELDVAAVVEALARSQSIRRLPRKLVLTLRRGAQVLVDLSETMNYFDTDRTFLLAELRQIVGADRLHIQGFVGCPSRGVFAEPHQDTTAYQPPPPGIPVLLISDLGRIRSAVSFQRALPAEWDQFLNRITTAGCPVRVLNPLSIRGSGIPANEFIRTYCWGQVSQQWSRSDRHPARRSSPLSPETPVPVRVLHRSSPLALELAELVSLAARIEPELLRTVRHEILPEADAATEAELWFSGLVSSRNPRAVLFVPETGEWLRKRLQSDPERLDRTLRVLRRFRQRARSPNVLRLEEQLTALALQRDPNQSSTAQDRLAQVLRSLTDNALNLPAEERHGLAHWAASTLPELPEAIRQTPVAKNLLLAARLYLSARRIPDADSSLPDDFTQTSWIWPKDFPVTTLGIRITSDGVEISEPPAESAHWLHNVPATHPRILRLKWSDKPFRTVRLTATGRQVSIPAESGVLTIQMLDGQQYELRPSFRETASSKQESFAAESLEIAAGVRLHRVLSGAKDPILRIGWSSSGTRIAAPSVDTTVWIWEVDADRPPVILEGHHHGVNDVAWSPDDSVIATVSFDRTFRLWSTATGEQLFEESPHGNDITTVSWSRKGNFIATGSADHRIVLWSVTPNLAQPRQIGVLEGHQDFINSLAWTADARWLASGSSDCNVCVWGSDGSLLRRLTGHTRKVICVDWWQAADGILASSSSDGTVRLWNVEAGEVDRVLHVTDKEVTSVSFSADGGLLAAKSMDGRVRIYRTQDWQIVAEFSEPNSKFWPAGLDFHPSEARLATLGERDRVVRILDLDPIALLQKSDEESNRQSSQTPDLESLPRWAAVAVVLRCARRVLPWLKTVWTNLPAEMLDTLQEILTRSETAAAEGKLRSGDAMQAIAAVTSLKFPAGHEAARRVSILVMQSATAAAAGTQAWPDVTKVLSEVLDDIAADRNHASMAKQTSEAIRKDVERASVAARAQGWDDDTAVAVEFFGPLWPGGPPADWPDPDRPPAATDTVSAASMTSDRMQVLQAALPNYLRRSRWFAGKTRTISATSIIDSFSVTAESSPLWMLLVRVDYSQEQAETYTVPVGFADSDDHHLSEPEDAHALVDPKQEAGLRDAGIPYDAVTDQRFWGWLLNAIAQQHTVPGASGKLVCVQTDRFRQLSAEDPDALLPAVIETEHDHHRADYNGRLQVKLFCRTLPGTHPDWQIGHYLTKRFPKLHLVPAVAGAIGYAPESTTAAADFGSLSTIAVLQESVRDAVDAWSDTLERLAEYLDRVAAQPDYAEPDPSLLPTGTLIELAEQPAISGIAKLIGSHLETAGRLGHRTAELHVALASGSDDPSFSPEPLTSRYQKAITAELLTTAQQALKKLEAQSLPDSLTASAVNSLLGQQSDLLRLIHSRSSSTANGQRIRIHGDLHLGQIVLSTQEPTFRNFARNPALSLSEAHEKSAALADVAGMLRSFHYATHAAQLSHDAASSTDLGPGTTRQRWLQLWYFHTAAAFLRSYLKTTSQGSFLPTDSRALSDQLNQCLISRSLYELNYELSNRPDWLIVPVQSLLWVLSSATVSGSESGPAMA